MKSVDELITLFSIFSTKNAATRLTETVEFIRLQNQEAAEKVYQWGQVVSDYEIYRVSEKMHLGKSGTKEE